jgi:hypothetical protein
MYDMIYLKLPSVTQNAAYNAGKLHGKEVEGIGCTNFKGMSRHLRGGLDEKHKMFHSG